ncbi:hypothetical protein NOR53_2567 [gamma proteobacterium NOR5-3]|nr:hypothetical protein NOR53_2567 [gamma proteobacterium NOR5-3]
MAKYARAENRTDRRFLLIIGFASAYQLIHKDRFRQPTDIASKRI